MTAPPREPQNLYDALSTIYDWLCDDRLTQWPYMENGPFYSDLPKYQEVARAALAAAPAPSADIADEARKIVQRRGWDDLATKGADDELGQDSASRLSARLREHAPSQRADDYGRLASLAQTAAALIDWQAREIAIVQRGRMDLRAELSGERDRHKRTQERAERAEAEAKEANERAHNETERRLRAEAERDALRECVRAADGQLSRVLHELAGSASLCWEPKPTGAFHSTQACEFVAAAIDELRAILRGDAARAKVKP